MRRHRIVLALCAATFTASASEPPPQAPQSGASAAAPVPETSCGTAPIGFNEIAAAGYRQKLPNSNLLALSHDDLYPLKGKREHLEGRVLVRFHIDAAGKAAAPQFMQIDAPRFFAESACTLLHQLKFDVSEPSSAGPYLVTIRYCLDSCSRLLPYPGSGDLSITGHSLPTSMPHGRFH